MAITYPLAHAEFAERLRVLTFRWQLQRSQQMSGLSGGELIKAEIAEPKWSAEVAIAALTRSQAQDIQATFEGLDAPGASFYLYNRNRPYPASDPTGSGILSSTVTINTISGNKAISLTGLPAGYVLTRGDMLMATYGSSPTRHALLRIMETVTASGGGTSPAFEVQPFLRAGIATGNAVDLSKPYCRMTLIPGSFEPGTGNVDGTVTGMGFRCIETRG